MKRTIPDKILKSKNARRSYKKQLNKRIKILQDLIIKGEKRIVKTEKKLKKLKRSWPEIKKRMKADASRYIKRKKGK